METPDLTLATGPVAPSSLTVDELTRDARGLLEQGRLEPRRSYRRALSHAEALAELQRCAGTQFDPRVVDALVQIAT